MYNAYFEICTAIDRSLHFRPVGRSKVIYSKSAKGYNILVPYLGEAESAAREAEIVLSLCPMAESALTSGNGILIRLTKPTLEDLLIKAAETAEPSEAEIDGDTDTGYAELKLRSLARGKGCTLYGAKSELRLAWLLMGITAYPNDAKRTAARLEDCALAVSELFKELSPMERSTVRNQCALIGRLGARLMSAGRRIIDLM